MSLNNGSFIALMVFVLIVVTVMAFTKQATMVQEITPYCESDADCVAASCCHSASCTHKDTAPDCSDTYCSADCEPGTLDCNQAKCICVNNQCQKYDL